MLPSPVTVAPFGSPRLTLPAPVDKPIDTAASFFGNAGPAWDGDVKKLFIINTEEQYNAVKKRFIELKDNNIKGPDLDRFEDMLQTYEEQIK